ncbi:agamous-like MADS-box protein AGL62 [Cornus florida]|uniref:agamous-like MADS-box protein AGL62 n=1 Tax=Cornus florida TaxID=4283 RepID=UPI0028980032|nr:agamous-like MADS-box protein AGL62 [Cornus florida]
MENKPKRHSKGRQKIPMKKIEGKSNLHVSFSKRRTGLINKAGELSIVCGAEVAVVVMSPAGKIYTFGSPSADTVVNRFLAQYPNPNLDSSTMSAHDHDDNKLRVQLQVSKNNYLKALGELEARTEQGKPSETRCWWEDPIDELGLQELEHYIASLEVLKKNVMNRVDKMAMVTNPADQMAMVMNQTANQMAMVKNEAADQMAMARARASPSTTFEPFDSFDQNLPMEGTSFGNDFGIDFGNCDFGNFDLGYY